MTSLFFFVLQWTLIITSSLEPEKFACYNDTLLYQGWKNNLQRKSESRDRQNYLVIMKVCYISEHYNKSPLYYVSEHVKLPR